MAIIRQLLLCHTKDKCHLIDYKPCFIHIVNINYLMYWILHCQCSIHSQKQWKIALHHRCVLCIRMLSLLHASNYFYRQQERAYPLDASSIDVSWYIRSGIPIIYQPFPLPTKSDTHARRFYIKNPIINTMYSYNDIIYQLSHHNNDWYT